MKSRAKGIGLLSGGLDSMLAVKVLQDQDADITVICYTTPFFGPKAGADASRILCAPVRLIDIGEEHLKMLRNPRYGYGSQMNPCIDCHALMLREAGQIMEEEGADFLFTGEVLGQRPMSQRRDSMRSVEKLSGYEGRVLRPLSAKLLPPTIPETEGLIDRDRLLDVQGRSRKRQKELAKHYGITEYPQPGGGCMLTKEGFSNKLRELLRNYPQAGPREAELLKWGRSFLLPNGCICIIGRNESDNRKIERLASGQDVLLHMIDFPGPTALVLASRQPEDELPTAASILIAYSDAQGADSVRVEWRHRENSGIIFEKNLAREHFTGCQI